MNTLILASNHAPFTAETDKVYKAASSFFDQPMGMFMVNVCRWVGIAIFIWVLVKSAGRLMGRGGEGGGGLPAFIKGLLPAVVALILLMNLKWTWQQVVSLSGLVGTIFDWIAALITEGRGETADPTPTTTTQPDCPTGQTRVDGVCATQ